MRDHEYELEERVAALEQELDCEVGFRKRIEEQRDRERGSADRYFDENGKLVHQIQTMRVENGRLLKLIQEQDKIILASDTATEIKLADKLADVLQRVNHGYIERWGQQVTQALNEWKTARGVDFEDKTMNSEKRVS